MTATVWPDFSRVPASSLPTRPHPTTTTCTSPSTASEASIVGRRTGRTASTGDRHGMLAATGWPSGQPSFSPDGNESPGDGVAILKRLLVGRPLATVEQEHQRIPKTIGLAVFSSDAISSTAYATEEILFVTAVGASRLALGLDTIVPIATAVAFLLALARPSCRQTVLAYPRCRRSHIASRENLGETPSLIAGGSLLVDYILTVAVSISAGVAAIISIPAFQGLATHRVELGLGLIA